MYKHIDIFKEVKFIDKIAELNQKKNNKIVYRKSYLRFLMRYVKDGHRFCQDIRYEYGSYIFLI
jgi:hypothetical protein